MIVHLKRFRFDGGGMTGGAGSALGGGTGRKVSAIRTRNTPLQYLPEISSCDISLQCLHAISPQYDVAARRPGGGSS